MSSGHLRGYAICTSPRTGSNFLCQLIASTGQLGNPLEYFNWRGRRVFENPAYPEDIDGQIQEILSTGRTPNGVYSFKVFAHQHDWISESINWTSALPNLSFVFLTRSDLLAQAISWSKAIQTGQYRSSQVANAKPTYDGSLIEEQLRRIVIENARWEFYFARTGVKPVRLLYEDIVAYPLDALNQIRDLVHVDRLSAPPAGRISVSIQRDELNDEWREKFRVQYGNPDVLHSL
jgi:LPS sulfotransferase NodH